jgi:hypothetical protein
VLLGTLARQSSYSACVQAQICRVAICLPLVQMIYIA